MTNLSIGIPGFGVPVQSLRIHSHVRLSTVQQKLVASRFKEQSWGTLGRRSIKIPAILRVDGDFNIVSFSTHFTRIKDMPGRTLIIEMEQAVIRNADIATELSDELNSETSLPDSDQTIGHILDLIGQQETAASTTCNVKWWFPKEEVESRVSLPLLMPVPGELNSMRGLRLADKNGDQWVTLDLSRDDKTIIVGARFKMLSVLDRKIMQQTLVAGEKFIGDIVHYRGDNK